MSRHVECHAMLEDLLEETKRRRNTEFGVNLAPFKVQISIVANGRKSMVHSTIAMTGHSNVAVTM